MSAFYNKKFLNKIKLFEIDCHKILLVLLSKLKLRVNYKIIKIIFFLHFDESKYLNKFI